MRVLVTGGSGRVGRYVVEELAQSGHDVTSLDLVRPQNPVSGVRTILGDAALPEDSYGAISYIKADAVIHMAAWSDPGIVADTRTFRDNVAATFNLLHVSAAQNVRRVICASSAQVYGFAEHAPVYACVDEEHPLRPLNSYAISKVACEQVADYFAQRNEMDVLSFRIMGARAPEDLPGEIEALAAHPENGRFLLWTRTDARDVAIACRQAIEVETVASGSYNITAQHNALECNPRDLLSAYCPQTELRGGLQGTLSPMTCAKASAAFGYAPRYR